MVIARVLVFTLPLGLLGCGKTYTPTVAHIAGAARVEVFRIDGMKEQRPRPAAPGETRFDGWTILSQGTDQGREFAAELADVLADKRTDTKEFEACFWPGVAFRAWKDGEDVDVLICFHCDNFYLGPPKDEAWENASEPRP